MLGRFFELVGDSRYVLQAACRSSVKFTRPGLIKPGNSEGRSEQLRSVGARAESASSWPDQGRPTGSAYPDIGQPRRRWRRTTKASPTIVNPSPKELGSGVALQPLQ